MWSAEWWNSTFELGGVILLFLTFAFGAGFVLTGKVIKGRQEAQLRQFDKDLTDAKTELGKQQVLVADAQGKVAGLERSAADAKTEMARQQERAAKAELELAKLKAPRVLTEAQQNDLIGRLKVFPGTAIEISFEYADGEAKELAMQLFMVLQRSGWKVSLAPPSPMVSSFAPASTLGIVVSEFGELQRGGVPIPRPRSAPAAEALSRALKEMGLLSTYPGIKKVSDNPDESVYMVVGRKPLQ
jgi:hypothetical protein